MATRVRKLARELKRTPAHVLGVLHAVGYVRYRSPEDMLPDAAIERVRRAEREGVKPVPLDAPPPKPAKPAKPAKAAKASANDLMSALVPGVRPVGDAVPAPAPTPVPNPSPAATLPTPEPVAVQTSSAERAQLDAERAQLDAERAQLDAERARLDAERAQLDAERDRLTAWSTELAAIQKAIDDAAAAEQEQAMATDLARLGARAGEVLMLSGLRRMVVAGGAPDALKALREGIDRRVDMRFVAGDRGRAEAESDVTRSDVVVLFGVAADAHAMAVYAASPITLVDAGDVSGTAGLLARIIQVLDSDIA